MTKWFDTNYHYIVPEFGAGTEFTARRVAPAGAARRGEGVEGVKRQAGDRGPGHLPRGWASPRTMSDKLALLPRLLPGVRGAAGRRSPKQGVEWVQVDEPAAGDGPRRPSGSTHSATAYHQLKSGAREAVAGHLLRPAGRQPLPGRQPAGRRACTSTPSTAAATCIPAAQHAARRNKVLSLGVVDGRNILEDRPGRGCSIGSSRSRQTASATACGSRRRARCCTCRSTWAARRSWTPSSSPGSPSRCRSCMNSRCSRRR